MNELLEIEKIKQLKARYFRALDTNDWALFGSTLTEVDPIVRTAWQPM